MERAVYYDMSLLGKTKLPNDDLFEELLCFDQHFDELFARSTRYYPFRNVVSVDLVSDPSARHLARRYILGLLENKRERGFLYFLADQENLYVPVILHFNTEMITENARVADIIRDMARDFFPPGSKEYFLITCIEILYFFVKLVNPFLNYVQIDYIVGCIKSHRHLIASPRRIIYYTKEK